MIILQSVEFVHVVLVEWVVNEIKLMVTSHCDKCYGK